MALYDIVFEYINFIYFKLYNFLCTRITDVSFNDRGHTISDKISFLSVFLFADLENGQTEGHLNLYCYYT